MQSDSGTGDRRPKELTPLRFIAFIITVMIETVAAAIVVEQILAHQDSISPSNLNYFIVAHSFDLATIIAVLLFLWYISERAWKVLTL